MEIKNWHMRFSALNIKKQPSTLCALTHWHACHMHYIINCHVLSELPEKGSGGGPHFRPTHVCLIVSSKAPCPGTGLSPTLWDRERRIQNTPLPDCESRRRVSQLGRNIVLEHSFGGITPAPSLSRRLWCCLPCYTVPIQGGNGWLGVLPTRRQASSSWSIGGL